MSGPVNKDAKIQFENQEKAKFAGNPINQKAVEFKGKKSYQKEGGNPARRQRKAR